MELDRFLDDAELSSDLTVSQPLKYESVHFALSSSQFLRVEVA